MQGIPYDDMERGVVYLVQAPCGCKRVMCFLGFGGRLGAEPVMNDAEGCYLLRQGCRVLLATKEEAEAFDRALESRASKGPLQ